MIAMISGFFIFICTVFFLKKQRRQKNIMQDNVIINSSINQVNPSPKKAVKDETNIHRNPSLSA